MQPMLALSADHPGLISINGHFAGELSPDALLLRPIAARGPLYLEYRPLEDELRPMARRLVFSGGVPLPESCENCGNANIVLWPNHVTELELTPRPWETTEERFSIAGRSCCLRGGPEPLLLCESRRLASLPAGASLPEYKSSPAGALLSGSCAGGSYLVALDRKLDAVTGFLRASRIEIGPDDAIHALYDAGDTVGHGMRESWQLTPSGLRLLGSEGVWTEGVPRWPQSPEECARAAVEAALAGLREEAEGYLAPELRARNPLDGLEERCDLCVPMKYLPGDARPCVGLLRLLGERLGRVEPLYYHAVPSDGSQGPWQLDFLGME